MLSLLLALAAAGVSTNFEAGNLAGSSWVTPSHLRITVHGEPDQDNRNQQPSWFYFRADVKAEHALVIDIAGLAGEYNYQKHQGQGLRNMRPVYSYDNRNWEHFESSEWIPAESTVRVRLLPKRGTVWIARQAPYTGKHLEALLRHLKRHRGVRVQVAGTSVEGRPIYLLSATDPSKPPASKKVLWLMARQHAWESGTSWVADGALRFLVSDDPEAHRIRSGCIVKVLPMADPDGVAKGGVRFNKYGYDLNRNWDAINPKLMPEIAAQRKAILAWIDAGNRVDLFLTLHNTESSEYISGPPGTGRDFWQRLTQGATFHSPDGPRDATETTSPGMKGRMTVAQGLYHERRIPAFLMEQMVDTHPKLGRPATVADRIKFGRDLLRVMASTVGCGDR